MASLGEDEAAASEPREEKKTASVSFGFTKTVSKFKPASGDAVIGLEERDYLTGIDENELKSSKPSEKPRELIIPLIHKNRWLSDGGQDSVEAQAVRELIQDSRRQLDEWHNGPPAPGDPHLSIPLLMQNKVPEGFEDGEQVRVDLRPESSTEADYESVPVEAYGLAMLKGMGWNKEEGIGRTFKQNVKPIEHQLRPKGLGLGANRTAIKDLEPKKQRRPPKPGEEPPREEEELVMGPGGLVLVQSGVHKDLYGKIEGLDVDNSRAMVKLAIGGKSVTVSQFCFKLVHRKEYDKYSRDLSRLSKAHKDKEKQKEREREREREEEEKRRRSHSELTNHRSAEREQRKRKHGSRDREKPPPPKAPPTAPPTWLHRDLKVRFIHRTFKGGKYYNSKMCVEDVLTPTTCVCRTEEGRLLDDVQQEMLETLVPKSDQDRVMVVLGPHRGQVGRILQRDKRRSLAVVQLEREDEEDVFNLDYDSICQYVGAADH